MKRLYDINVHGSFYTAREAAKHMIPQGCGSIVLIASMSATVGTIEVHLGLTLKEIPAVDRELSSGEHC
jgi:NAD(P)-dependent dehydrogenase (short-subunit alcohol dehydrogenase family)